MSEKDWWSLFGSFKRWKKCPSRPDPSEVLLFYLERRGIRASEHVGFLVEKLGLQKSMAYNVLNGEGFDAISRCRRLVQVLEIYPPLLGVDAKHFPIEYHPFWWYNYGFDFHADEQGYPKLLQVVAYLRGQRKKILKGGELRGWTQEDLGDATGLSKEIAFRMEHDKRPYILENMSRRARVASALGTLAGKDEPTIFRLFGLDPQAYRVPIPISESLPAFYFFTHQKPNINDILQGYQQKLATFFTDYYTGHAQNTVREMREWVLQLPALLPLTQEMTTRIHLLALQSRIHRLLACIAREQSEEEQVLFHTGKAIELASQAVTLVSTSEHDNHPLWTTVNELLASALFTTAMASYERNEYKLAQEHIDRALELFPALQSRHLQAEILGAAALIHAYTAIDSADQRTVLSYIDQGLQACALGQFQVDVPDNNFFRCDSGMFFLYQAWALSAPKMQDVIGDSVLSLLNDAQRWTAPALIRRHAVIAYLQARASFAAGNYLQATEFALNALEKSIQIHSRLNRDRIEKVYQQLLNTPERDKPLFAYLGMKLRTWDYE